MFLLFLTLWLFLDFFNFLHEYLAPSVYSLFSFKHMVDSSITKMYGNVVFFCFEPKLIDIKKIVFYYLYGMAVNGKIFLFGWFKIFKKNIRIQKPARQHICTQVILHVLIGQSFILQRLSIINLLKYCNKFFGSVRFGLAKSQHVQAANKTQSLVIKT